MKNFWNEFKAFAMRGNVVDLAVAVIIGAAFGKITTSLVNDIIMPALGLLLGDRNLSEYKYVLKEAVVEAGEVTKEAVTINYGSFIEVIINFLVIALAVFMIIRGINKLRRKKEEAAPAPTPPAPTAEEKLLAEIRDLLAKQNKG